MAPVEAVPVTTPTALDLPEGRRIYEEFAARPQITGGPGAATEKRCRAVFEKFLGFAAKRGIRSWNDVNRSSLDEYARHLEERDYAYATRYLELTTLKQVLKHLTTTGHLPAELSFSYPLRKPTGTGTYCWRTDEVSAMIERCNQHPELKWLGDVIVSLVHTGLRISELASLLWTDIDWERNLLSIPDERMKAKVTGERRQTKSGHSRTLPIHPDLAARVKDIPKSSDNRIYHGPLGGRLKPDTVRRALVRDILTPLASEFPEENGFTTGRLHSFRHYFCSVCADSGVPEQVLMSWLGHRDSRMVRHYYHLHDAESQRQIAKVKLWKQPDPRGSGELSDECRGGAHGRTAESDKGVMTP